MSAGKTFLHIGLQKTASTYFQERIFPKAAGLAYIGRPYTQENKALNMLQYADESLYNRAAMEAELQQIRQAADGMPLLISDELFAGSVPYGFINRGFIANRLSELIPDAEVILFLRGQVDLLYSLYNQYVKTGTYLGDLDVKFLRSKCPGFSLSEWENGRRKWDEGRREFSHYSLMSAHYFDYDKLVHFYQARFGNIHVFLYEDFKSNPNAQLERLEDILSAKLPRLAEGEIEMVNRGLNERELRTKILENKLSSLMDERFKKLRWARVLTKTMSRFITLKDPAERREFISRQLREAGVFDGNRRLNLRMRLGMEQHAKSYFDAR